MQILWCYFIIFCSTCFGCNTHPSSGATYNVNSHGKTPTLSLLQCIDGTQITYKKRMAKTLFYNR